jgi:hypothetical protein
LFKNGGAESTPTYRSLLLQEFLPALDFELRLLEKKQKNGVSLATNTRGNSHLHCIVPFLSAFYSADSMCTPLLTQLCMYSASILSEHIPACTSWLKVEAKKASTLLIITSLAGGECGGAVDARSADMFSHVFLLNNYQQPLAAC